MNRIDLENIRHKLKSSPSFMKKVKIFVIVIGIGFLLTTGLVVWGTIAAINYVASASSKIKVSEPMQSVTAELQGLQNIISLACWNRTLSFLNWQVWVSRPLGDNLNDLKLSCLGPPERPKEAI